MNELRYDDRVAVVTGAGRGVGRGHAMLLGSRGAKVVVADLGGALEGGGRDPGPAEQVAKEIEAAGGEAIAVCGSVADEKEAASIVQAALDNWGRIDIVVNNDGAPPLGPTLDFDDTAWAKAVEQNLMYVVRMARGALPHMKRRGGGSILNITAISAIQPLAKFGLSVATWSGVIGFAKTLSIEAAPFGITVNTICPGYIETSRLEKVFAAGGAYPEIMRNQLKAEVPLKRIGTVDDVAALVALLVSPRGSYITGTTIQVDGGLLRAVR
jgi:3-oxoacyl-[acyl-carrier protein] reductase